MGTKIHREVTYGDFTTASTDVRVTLWDFGKRAQIEASVQDWEKDTNGNWVGKKRVDFQRNYSDIDEADTVYEHILEHYIKPIEVSAGLDGVKSAFGTVYNVKEETEYFVHHLNDLKGGN